jgi:hypothetical protein
VITSTIRSWRSLLALEVVLFLEACFGVRFILRLTAFLTGVRGLRLTA